MKQTDDNREGMYEGVIACYLDERIDSEEFWEVIDNRIYAEHETVLDFIEFVTEGSGYIYAWLDDDQSNDLITACPTLKEHLIRKGFDVDDTVEAYGVKVDFYRDCNIPIRVVNV